MESSTVESEGATIHFWYQGSGPLLILIPGGGGNGHDYDRILPLLSQKYTALTFDRRGNGQSRTSENKPLNPAQQARDIIAIIKNVGFQKAYIFGSSGGGVIALTLASLYPKYVQQVIAHEAPTYTILPDASEWIDFCYSVYDTYKAQGPLAAWKIFFKSTVGLEFDGDDIPHSTGDYFFQYEYLFLTLFTPDLLRIRENGVQVKIGVGIDSGDAPYARTTMKQAEILDCPKLVFPGHHTGYISQAETFSQILINTL